MHGFGSGAEDFDAGLSEAIDRARTLLRNVYNAADSEQPRGPRRARLSAWPGAWTVWWPAPRPGRRRTGR